MSNKLNLRSGWNLCPGGPNFKDMKLFIASDHAGFELKAQLMKLGASVGVTWEDLGPTTAESTDYPVYAQKLAEAVLHNKTREELLEPCGVLICGSGVGVSIAANRFEGIRAVLTLDAETAVLSRQHNASNVLCLGARLIQPEVGLEILRAWLKTPFEGGRHERRVQLIEKK